MEISKELLDMGLTEELLLFYHNRTANSDLTIKSAYISKYDPYLPDGGVKVILVVGSELRELSSGLLQYVINVAKIRQKRLNILLNVK
jgi:hypothetical protein